MAAAPRRTDQNDDYLLDPQRVERRNPARANGRDERSDQRRTPESQDGHQWTAGLYGLVP